MGNAASSGSAPRTAVAPQGKAADTLRDHQPQSAGTEQRPAEPSWEAALSDPIIAATLWLAVATTALGWFTYRLWRATIKLAADTKTSGEIHASKMERAIAEAGKSAKAAQDTAAISQDTAERQLRAYVVPSAFRVECVETGGIPTFVFSVRNSGQTPAYEVRTIAKPFSARDGTASDEKVRFGKAAVEMSRGVIGSQGLIRFRVPWKAALGEQLLQDVRDGKVEIGVFGVISYRDAFKRRRLATFKRYLDPCNLKAGGKGRLTIGSRGNNAN